MDQSATLQAVRPWALNDRVDFLFRLWDDLVQDGWQPEPTEELTAEFDRRLVAHEADPGNVRTWEQVVERIRRPR